jgi:hypothetical protein
MDESSIIIDNHCSSERFKLGSKFSQHFHRTCMSYVPTNGNVDAKRAPDCRSKAKACLVYYNRNELRPRQQLLR